MAGNEEDYELVRRVLDEGDADEALKALARIKQNREWEALRAYNKGKSDAERQAKEGAHG